MQRTLQGGRGIHGEIETIVQGKAVFSQAHGPRVHFRFKRILEGLHAACTRRNIDPSRRSFRSVHPQREVVLKRRPAVISDPDGDLPVPIRPGERGGDLHVGDGGVVVLLVPDVDHPELDARTQFPFRGPAVPSLTAENRTRCTGCVCRNRPRSADHRPREALPGNSSLRTSSAPGFRAAPAGRHAPGRVPV